MHCFVLGVTCQLDVKHVVSLVTLPTLVVLSATVILVLESLGNKIILVLTDLNGHNALTKSIGVILKLHLPVHRRQNDSAKRVSLVAVILAFYNFPTLM